MNALVLVLAILPVQNEIRHHSCFTDIIPFEPSTFGPIGQTFRATDAVIATIGVAVEDYFEFAPNDDTITLDLFSGDGFDGPIIATATTQPFHVERIWIFDVSWAVFHLAADVTVDQLYTFRISAQTERWAVFAGFRDRYADGHGWIWGNPYWDLRFVVSPLDQIDAECTVDLVDVALLAECLSGPQNKTTGFACGDPDLKSDGDVDLRDVADAQNMFRK